MAGSQKNIKKSELAFDPAKGFDFFRMVLNTAPLVIWALDEDGIFILSEGKGLAALKLEPGQVVGQSVFKLYKKYPNIIEATKAALAGKEVSNIWEVDGIFYDSRYVPMKDEGGKVIGAIGLSLDITSQMHDRERVEESERRYREMVELSPIGIFINLKNRVVYMNNAAKRMYKIESDEQLKKGVSALELRHPDYRRSASQQIAKVLKDWHPKQSIEQVMMAFDGSTFDAEVSWVPFIFEGQKALQVFVHDISERKKIERVYKELNAVKEDYQKLFNDLPIGVYKNTPGPEGHFIEVNPAIVKFFEASSAEELMSHKVSDLYQVPAQRKKFSDKLLANGTVVNEELSLKTLKGKPITALVSAVVREGRDGEIYYYGTFQDITNIKNITSKLAINEKRFRSIFENAIIGAMVVNLESFPTDINAAMQEFIGYSAEELKKIPFTKFIFAEDADKNSENFNQLRAGKIPYYQMEVRCVRKDGKVVWGRLNVSLIKDESGVPLFAMTLIESIDEQKKIQEELAGRLTELERLNKLMIGREIKMMELKREIDALKRKIV